MGCIPVYLIIKEKVSPVTFIQKRIFGFRLSDYIRLMVGWLV